MAITSPRDLSVEAGHSCLFIGPLEYTGPDLGIL